MWRELDGSSASNTGGFLGERRALALSFPDVGFVTLANPETILVRLVGGSNTVSDCKFPVV